MEGRTTIPARGDGREDLDAGSFMLTIGKLCCLIPATGQLLTGQVPGDCHGGDIFPLIHRNI